MYITVKGIFELSFFFRLFVDTPLNFKTLNFMPENIFQIIYLSITYMSSYPFNTGA